MSKHSRAYTIALEQIVTAWLNNRLSHEEALDALASPPVSMDRANADWMLAARKKDQKT